MEIIRNKACENSLSGGRVTADGGRSERTQSASLKAHRLVMKARLVLCCSVDAKSFTLFFCGGQTRAINRVDAFRTVSGEVLKFTLVGVHHRLKFSAVVANS